MAVINRNHWRFSSEYALGFQSKYFDQETGLYYFYNRYYSPTIGRFINEDPIGLVGGLNLYRFLSNNPVNYIDLLGLNDELTETLGVKKRICCILESAQVLTGGFTGEKSFMVYENNMIPNLYTYVIGEGPSTRTSTQADYPVREGWHFKAYYHAHPPEGNTFSNRDKNISRNYDIPVYFINETLVCKWYRGRPTSLGQSQSLIGWCLNNRNQWECVCNNSN